MRKLLATTCALGALIGWSATGAMGAANPVGKGEPGVASEGAECGTPGSETFTKGFETEAFEAATFKYAGSSEASLKGNQAHAISEYDIACFQQEERINNTR